MYYFHFFILLYFIYFIIHITCAVLELFHLTAALPVHSCILEMSLEILIITGWFTLKVLILPLLVPSVSVPMRPPGFRQRCVRVQRRSVPVSSQRGGQEL